MSYSSYNKFHFLALCSQFSAVSIVSRCNVMLSPNQIYAQSTYLLHYLLLSVSQSGYYGRGQKMKSYVFVGLLSVFFAPRIWLRIQKAQLPVYKQPEPHYHLK